MSFGSSDVKGRERIGSLRIYVRPMAKAHFGNVDIIRVCCQVQKGITV